MALGDRINFNFQEITDDVTGKKMTRITPKGVLSHHPYFYNKMFTSDGKSMILASMINGARDYYLLDMATGVARQITDNHTEDSSDGGFSADDFGGFISPCDKYMYYVNNGKFTRLDLETLDEEVIYVGTESWAIGGPIAMSSDGKYIISTNQYLPDTVTDQATPWRNFLEQGKRGKRSKLVIMNLETKEERVLLDTKFEKNLWGKHNQWLTHPLFRPNNNDFISYAHEGLGGTVDARIWFIDAEGKNNRCPRKHDFDGQIISHEFWFKNGKKMGYVRIDDSEGMEGKICMMDPDTLEDEVIVSLPRCSHFITSHDDRYVIADGSLPDAQYMTPDLVPEEDRIDLKALFIYLVDIEDKSYKKIISHRSSSRDYGHNQDAHPHPSFTPDNKSFVFTSDFEGLPHVYLVDLED